MTTRSIDRREAARVPGASGDPLRVIQNLPGMGRAPSGLGILAHDAVHKVLMKKLWLNEFIGGIISALALLPFNANRQFHLTHHRFAHQKTFDPEEPMHNHNLLFALTAGSVIGLNAQYKIFFFNLFKSFNNISYVLKTMQDMFSLLVAGCA